MNEVIHNTKNPRRTVLAAPEQSKHTNKWSAAFNMFATFGGEEHLMSTATSGAVFDTAADAEEGGKRALVVLHNTGKFPNMCEAF